MTIYQTACLFIATSIVLLGAMLFFIFRYLHYKRYAKEKWVTIEDKYKSKLTDYESEIRRQGIILKNYQNKIQNKEQREELETIQVNQTSSVPANSSEQELKEILQEKLRLEKEREQFQDKTKKLWEQSLAIHKEKERIDSLRKEISIKHKHVTDSITYAKNIQSALLTPDTYLKEILPPYFIFFRPRDVVSGDFYWIKQIKEYTVVVVADCTGHGVPGAFMSMLGIAFLNEIIDEYNKPDAADILEQLRKNVITALHQDQPDQKSRDGMDMSICIIDKQNKQLQYAGAHNPLYLCRNNELKEYKATSAPVGYMVKVKPFVNETITYEENDYIYMFSDGFVDQFGGPEGGKFKSKYFKEFLAKISNPSDDIQIIHKKLEQTLSDWMGERYAQIDDILVVGLKLISNT